VSRQVFAEGEFFDVQLHWHYEVPCEFNKEEQVHEASVEMETGARFRFYYFDESKVKSYTFSTLYETEVGFDG
jgi:hypothetical protein